MNDGQFLANATPVAEVEITSSLVTSLLLDQHRDLAHLTPVLVGEGWDNAMFRLGDCLAVRLPRRAAAAKLIGHEQIWLPRLAPHLSLPVPAACRIGTGAAGYPWCWSVVPWLPGRPADQDEPGSSEAARLGNFLRSVHVPPATGAPINPMRGVPLQLRAIAMEERLRRLTNKTSSITGQIWQIWESGLKAPIDVPSTWLHGDLHPLNILVERGVIRGVIDWGDITAGDCATDLASIWMLFAEPQAHKDALSAYAEVSEATLRRAKAWAVLFAVMLLDNGLTDNPRNARLGKKILASLTIS